MNNYGQTGRPFFGKCCKITNILPIVAVGKNLNDIKRDITEAIQVYKDSCAELGVETSALVKGEYELFC